MYLEIVKLFETNQFDIGPDGRTVHSGERESNGKYTFAAHQEGVYKYCFSNQVSKKNLCFLVHS